MGKSLVVEWMSSEERVKATLQHREPDRVCLDGWFGLNEIKVLQRHFGVEDYVSLREKMGIDFYWAYMQGSEEFRRRIAEKHSTMMWLDAIPKGGGLYVDEWGIELKVGATGDFYHYVKHPLQGVKSLKDYAFPDVDTSGRFDKTSELVDRLRDSAVIIAWGAAPTLFMKACNLRGSIDLIRDLYTNQEFVEELTDRLADWAIRVSKKFLDLGVEIIAFADDLGAQQRLQINPSLWRRFFKPKLAEIIREVKGYGAKYIVFHTDGDVRSIIPDLIEIGVDILNPIQPECMDPVEIKRSYGKDLTLHGSISMQETLPFGTTDDVKREVVKRIETCAEGGGFCLAPANRITPDIPMENILILYKTAREYILHAC